jgi:hypothetical protein
MGTPRSIDEIIERQVRLWELSRKRSTAKTRERHPVVTVSRQFGARGAAIARIVADRLGYARWDREVLEAIARDADAPASLYAALDEHRKQLINERIAVLATGRHVTADDYHARLLRVLHTIEGHGHSVVVGRGAECVLDPRATLRVRVVCPLDARVSRLAERRGIAEPAARDLVTAADADRRDFVREHYGRDVDDATGYDLVLNIEQLSVDQAADLVVRAHELRFGTAGAGDE